MANMKRANTSGVTKSGTAISDVPDAPTIGTATDSASDGTVSVTFTAAPTGGAVTTFTATSTPGSITATSASSPISVTGLTNGTAYTFKVKGTNSTATGPESSASNSATPTIPYTQDFDLIASLDYPSGTSSSLSFTGISGYTHLWLVVSTRTANSGNSNGSISFNYNGDTTSQKAGSQLQYYRSYNNSSAGSNYGWNTTTGGDWSTMSYKQGSHGLALIPMVTNTTRYKSFWSSSGNDYNTANNGSYDDAVSQMNSSYIENASAISSLTITNSYTTYAAPTSIQLYGMK